MLPGLLLEEVFEGLARVVGTRRRHGCRSGGLSVGGRRGVFFNRHAKFVEGAIGARVLGGDALGNGLGAFELRAGVEEAALLAAMQLKLALRAFAVGVEARGEDRAAVGAAGARNGANHARRARTELIGATRTTGWRLLFMRALALLTFFGIAVTAMTILAIHKYLHAPALKDRYGYNLDLCATMCQLGLYPIGLLHSAGPRNAYRNVLVEMAYVREQETGPLCL